MSRICLLRAVALRRFLPSSPTLVRLVVVSLAAGCVEGGSPTDETRSGRKPVLVGARVVRAPDNPRFHADTQVIVQGRRDGSGACMLGYELTLKKGEHVVGRYAEIDLDTCTYVVELGTYDRPSRSTTHVDTPRAQLHRHPARTFKRGRSTLSLFSNPMVSTSTISCARQILWFEDPAQIRMSESELHVVWEWEVGEEQLILWADVFAYAIAHTSTGWKVVRDEVELNDFYPGAWEANHWASMDNWSFPCPEPPPTWTFYHPNRVTFWGNGNVWFSHTAWAQGMCSTLLTLYFDTWQDY